MILFKLSITSETGSILGRNLLINDQPFYMDLWSPKNLEQFPEDGLCLAINKGMRVKDNNIWDATPVIIGTKQ